MYGPTISLQWYGAYILDVMKVQARDPMGSRSWVPHGSFPLSERQRSSRKWLAGCRKSARNIGKEMESDAKTHMP